MTAGTTHSRKSRYQRSEKPSGLVLQDRDRSILIACYEYRFLTRFQIQRLVGTDCVTRINARLRKLYDHSFLDRRVLPTLSGSGKILYLLGKEGTGIVGDCLGIDSEVVKRERLRDRNTSALFLEHDLSVNDFRVAVTNAIDVDGRFKLLRWHNPRACEQQCEIVEEGKSKRTSLRPDSFFQVLFADRVFSFFVELDLSTSGHIRLAHKFSVYARFAELGLAKEAFGVTNFYVLVLTKSSERRDNLKELAGNLGSDTIWVAQASDLQSMPLTSRSWYRSGEASIRSLFPPLTTEVLA